VQKPPRSAVAEVARRSREQQQFAQAEQKGSESKRKHEIHKAEDQQRCQQLLLGELWKPDQHRHFNDAETYGRVAQEAAQNRRDEYHEQGDESDRWMSGNEDMHRERPGAES